MINGLFRKVNLKGIFSSALKATEDGKLLESDQIIDRIIDSVIATAGKFIAAVDLKCKERCELSVGRGSQGNRNNEERKIRII